MHHPARLRRPLGLLALASVALAGCATAPPPAAPVAATAPDFDAALAAYGETARRAAAFDGGGTIRDLRWNEGAGLLAYRRGDAWFEVRLDTGEVVELTEEPARGSDAAGDRGDRRGRARPARGRQRSREASPDGTRVAVCRDWNVLIEPAEGVEGETIAVTTDGDRKVRYGTASWVYGEELAQNDAMWWSPDGSRLVFYRFDERQVPDHLLLADWTGLHPRLLTEGYPKPGEPNPVASLMVHELATGATFEIDARAGADPEEPEWYVYDVRFAPGGELLFNRTNRHQNVLEVMACDLASRAVRLVVRETQATWQDNRPAMRFLADGVHFVWETDRNGFRQYQLRSLDGTEVAMLSRAESDALGIERLDEAAGWLWYRAAGVEDPLDVHLHRVRLDGRDHAQLTDEPGRHEVQFSPGGGWFVDVVQSVDAPPRTVLRASDGRRVAVLAEPDPQRVADAGFPPPERFVAIADDGETELHGVLYRPAGFDPARRHPLVIDVYGGPDSRAVTGRHRLAHPATAFGWCVAQIDGRGTTGRGKAFLGAGYLRLGTVDVADQVAGVRHLLATRSYLDPDRVGIYGHSYGGYISAIAILRHPDVFAAAAAGAPVTDWRQYDTIYTERYMRTPAENPDGYRDGSCLTWAENLRGRLIILHGMVDDNVHPSNAFSLMDALQDAGKDFEAMFYPDAGHGLPAHSGRQRWRFLHDALDGRD